MRCSAIELATAARFYAVLGVALVDHLAEDSDADPDMVEVGAVGVGEHQRPRPVVELAAKQEFAIRPYLFLDAV